METKKYDQTSNTYLRPDVEYIKNECAFMRGCLDGTIDVHEPDCYSFLGLAAFFEDNDKTAWEGLNSFSSPTIDKMDKAAKLEQARTAQTGPTTCNYISGKCGRCKDCQYFGKITTPLQIRRYNFDLQLAYAGELSKKPAEIEIVAFILHQMKMPFDIKTATIDPELSPILKEGTELEDLKKDYFHWNGKQWQLMTEVDIQKIRDAIQLACLTSSSIKVECILKALLKKIPYNDTQRFNSFFHQRTDMANFQNGTLRAIRNGKHYRVEYVQHNKDDRPIYTLPFDYTPTPLPIEGSEFHATLKRIFKGDSDIDQKIEATQQIFGSAIFPIFPHVTFIVGLTGAGKSTLLKWVTSLVGERNMSHMELNNRGDFGLQGMEGKNVNLVSDISTKSIIDEGVLKRVEDHAPVYINRKNRAAIMVPLPSCHIFGANEMPPVFENSQALLRRVTIIRCNNSFTKGEEEMRPEARTSDKNFAASIWEQEGNIIQSWAVEGAIKLLEQSNGHYLNPESSVKEAREWNKSNDYVQQWIDAIKDGEVPGIICSEAHSALRTAIYQNFCAWLFEEFNGQNSLKYPSRNKFYKLVEQKGYAKKRSREGRFLQGFSIDSNSIQTF
jgi:phage/plasmid-associated DNA primase